MKGMVGLLYSKTFLIEENKKSNNGLCNYRLKGG